MRFKKGGVVHLHMYGISGRTKWSVHDYVAELCDIAPRCSGLQDQVERQFSDLFPAGPKEFVSSPCVVGDKDGLLLTWYLPGVLSPKRQVI